MDQKTIREYFKGHYKVVVFFVVFALVQFYFFWGLCHLMPGERDYQRMARIKAGKAPAITIADPFKKSQVPNFETEMTHTHQVLDSLRRSGQSPKQTSSN